MQGEMSNLKTILIICQCIKSTFALMVRILYTTTIPLISICILDLIKDIVSESVIFPSGKSPSKFS